MALEDGKIQNGELQQNGVITNGVLQNGDLNHVNEKDVQSENLPPELWTPIKNGENKNVSEYVKLPPEEWDAPKKTPPSGGNQGSPRKKKLSYEEIIQLLEEKIKVRLENS